MGSQLSTLLLLLLLLLLTATAALADNCSTAVTPPAPVTANGDFSIITLATPTTLQPADGWRPETRLPTIIPVWPLHFPLHEGSAYYIADIGNANSSSSTDYVAAFSYRRR